MCPDCFNEVALTSDFISSAEKNTGKVLNNSLIDSTGNEINDEYYCSVCDKEIDEYDESIWPDSPLSFNYDANGYKITQDGDSPDLFILRSPYYTYCQFCSPCAPGAGHLENPIHDGVKSYCLGPDWFEGGIAPYLFYRINKALRPIV